MIPLPCRSLSWPKAAFLKSRAVSLFFIILPGFCPSLSVKETAFWAISQFRMQEGHHHFIIVTRELSLTSTLWFQIFKVEKNKWKKKQVYKIKVSSPKRIADLARKRGWAMSSPVFSYRAFQQDSGEILPKHSLRSCIFTWTQRLCGNRHQPGHPKCIGNCSSPWKLYRIWSQVPPTS